MSTRCPFCSHQNPRAATRCEKCRAWLTQSADVPTNSATVTPVARSAVDLNGVLDPDFIAELLECVRSGQKIEAIRRLREATGSGLVEAKDAVEALEAGRQAALLGGQTPPASSDDDEILGLLRAGNKIAAIKLRRERTGVGLKEAKEAVEALGAAHGISSPQGVGCGAATTMLLLGIVVVVFFGVGLVFFGKWAAFRALGM